MATIDEWLEKGRQADGVAMSDERLSEVFDLVKADGNWKLPITATVAKTAANRAELEAAVGWFAGGLPDIEDQGDTWLVTGAGYYEWIGS